MATQGAVAVIIPAHNRRHTVTKAVGSVLGQTYRDLQCIVVDNGSNDDTGEALGTLSDPRLTVLSEPRPLGPSLARNVGVSAALGASWVTFLDSDDYWAPDKVEQQIEALAQYPLRDGAQQAASVSTLVSTCALPPGWGGVSRRPASGTWYPRMSC